ncbi:MAG TPA: endonuclease/exonuclease/phosphatase family protein [Rectinemataceae bacterium]
MSRKRISFLLPFAFLLFAAFRCSLPWTVEEPKDYLIVAYNAHNLFDAQESGLEYPEFRLSNGSWNQELYAKRLDLTAKVLLSVCPDRGHPPDILCLSEIENENVLRDLAEGPLKSAGYRWACAGGPSDSPVRCCVLSRFPIISARAHSSSAEGGQVSGRDMLEIHVELGSRGGKGGASRLTIFVCHWKSRIEGKQKTEPARRAAAALLASRIEELRDSEPSVPIVVCGDFNESPDEFARAGGAYPTAFMPAVGEKIPDPRWLEDCLLLARNPEAIEEQGGKIALFTPWELAGGYSYVYKGEKERLDGFLLSRGLMDGTGLDFLDFFPVDDPSLLSSTGEPLAWNGKTGYSDHLPIALRLELRSFDKSL